MTSFQLSAREMGLSSGRAGHSGDRVFWLGKTPRRAEEGIADLLVENRRRQSPLSAMDTITPRP
jgi:hypothetical protein